MKPQKRTNLGACLNALRRLRNPDGKTTLRVMASEVGISLATYHRIENGKDMDSKHLLTVLNWLMREEGK